MRSDCLVLSFFLLLSFGIVHAVEPFPEFLINVTHVSPQTDLVIPNLENTFSIDVYCFKASSHYMQGDIINFNVTVCANTLCSQLNKFDLLYKDNCFVEKQYTYFVPIGTQNVSLTVSTKRFDEPEISYTKYLESQFASYVPPAVKPVEVKPKRLGERQFFGFLTIPIVALLFFITGVVFVAFRKLFGVVLMLLAVMLFIFGLLF